MFLCGRIIASLSAEERSMFIERIKFLDRKIQPGLVKLTWSARGVAEFFVQDCRQLATRVGVAEMLTQRRWLSEILPLIIILSALEMQTSCCHCRCFVLFSFIFHLLSNFVFNARL